MILNDMNFMKNNRQQQTGVVLFIALIALLVMSLAAVALIRSVDTNSQITGNLSYRQTATISSSYGIEGMADKLGALAYDESFNDGTSSDPTAAKPKGYYATCTNFDTGGDRPCSGGDLTLDATWNAGTTSALATGLGMTAGVDPYGNRIEYIVERMCTAVGEVGKDKCLLDGIVPDNDTKNVLNITGLGRPKVASDLPLYRVTVRIQGPKNTVSYIQTFIS